jgi:hypothetical protein
LRKKPLSIVPLVYTNSENAIAWVPHPSERSAAESKNLLLDPSRKGWDRNLPAAKFVGELSFRNRPI